MAYLLPTIPKERSLEHERLHEDRMSWRKIDTRRRRDCEHETQRRAVQSEEHGQV